MTKASTPSDLSEAALALDRELRRFEDLADQAARLKLTTRSEEHTSELQSPCNLVCRLLLEKKKKTCGTCSGMCSSARSRRCSRCSGIRPSTMSRRPWSSTTRPCTSHSYPVPCPSGD